jgi:hypothetical protein
LIACQGKQVNQLKPENPVYKERREKNGILIRLDQSDKMGGSRLAASLPQFHLASLAHVRHGRDG